jgi:DNA-binding protein H-NS
MAVDLTKLSRKDLLELVQAAQEQLQERTAKHRQETRDRLIAAAEEAGYELGQLFGYSKPRKTKVKVVKYRHRENPALTWGGRGKRPQWVHDWLAGGGSMDALLIG